MAVRSKPPGPRVGGRPLVLLAAVMAVLVLLTAVRSFSLVGSSVALHSAFDRRSWLPTSDNTSTAQDVSDAELVDALLVVVRAKQNATGVFDVVNQTVTEQAPVGRSSVVVNSADAAAVHTADPNLFAGRPGADDIHIVFSMSCDQGRRALLQTVLQYSAAAVGQRGPMTQILSGCSAEQKAAILREPTVYPDFRRHFTPAYSPHPVPGVDDAYTPYNKPFALRHFLLHASPPVREPIIALIDADMVFFRKLEVNTGRSVTQYYRGSRDPATVNDSVVDGLALAHDWSNYLGDGWYAPDYADRLAAVCGDQPCAKVTADEAREAFVGTGPPYVMTRGDMARMVDDYCDFVVKGRQVADDWMTEMYAYTLAAANRGIVHTPLTNLGVTHPTVDAGDHEYWRFVDGDNTPNPCADQVAVVVPDDPPVSVHYCQQYGFVEGDEGHFFYKYDVPESLTDCDSPLLKVPPASDWDELLLREPDTETRRRKRHEVWFACSMAKIVNQAALQYKQRSCPAGYNTFRSIELSTAQKSSDSSSNDGEP